MLQLTALALIIGGFILKFGNELLKDNIDSIGSVTTSIQNAAANVYCKYYLVDMYFKYYLVEMYCKYYLVEMYCKYYLVDMYCKYYLVETS